MAIAESVQDVLTAVLKPGDRVLVGDGMGPPAAAVPALYAVAEQLGDIKLVLGWTLTWPRPLDRHPFAEIRTLLGSPFIRDAITSGTVKAPPIRLASVPALVKGTLRPDVLLVAVRRCGKSLVTGSQVGWIPAALETGATVVAVVDEGLPPLGMDLLGFCDPIVVSAPPTRQALPRQRAATEDEVVIAKQVASFVPEGACVQFGTGAFVNALAEAIQAPVSVLSGVITGATRTLDQRGMLLDHAVGAYLVGDAELHKWATRHVRLERFEEIFRDRTCGKFVAINTALEIDQSGQVNAERTGSRAVTGAGGHPDFCAMAARHPGGLSVLAMPTQRSGRSTLVDHLSCPTSTLRADVQVVVTERGSVDLRGLDDAERADALRDLWGAEGTRKLCC